MPDHHGNLFSNVSGVADAELFQTLLERPGLKIERIVSTGQASPPGFWYDSPQDEWVVLLSGSAALCLDGESGPRVLGPGDWLFLPAHCRHRVEWTEAGRETVWLAVHCEAEQKAG